MLAQAAEILLRTACSKRRFVFAQHLLRRFLLQLCIRLKWRVKDSVVIRHVPGIDFLFYVGTSGADVEDSFVDERHIDLRSMAAVQDRPHESTVLFLMTLNGGLKVHVSNARIGLKPQQFPQRKAT
jgi:hypothetical protein